MIHVMYAALLIINGSVMFAGGLYIIAGSDIAIAALTLLAGSGLAALGLYLLGAAVVILAHESWLKETLDRWLQ